MRRPVISILALLALSALAIIIPAAVSAGGGCHAPDGSVYTEGPTTVVKMDVCSFAPTIARVPVGTEVRFLNSSDIDHMVVGRGNSWRSEMLHPGREFSATFETIGTHPFSCPLHPGMVGAIVVGDGVAAGAAPAADAAPAAAVATDPPVSSAGDSDLAATPVATTDTDWAPIAIAAVGGLVAGAIAGTMLAGAWLNRRRSSPFATD